MDFDLHFGRFFGPKIDVFEKFLLPDFELQLEIRSAKIVILPGENAVFYKIDILALKWQPMKNIKKTGKTSLRNQVVFSHWFFLDFGANLDGFWPPSWGQSPRAPSTLFPSCGQEASKRRPRGSKSVPRASQEPPTASQEGPKSAQERPKRAQGTPKVPPEGHFFEDFLVFQCFSAFFCVFLRFSVFFCVFSVFFYSVPPLTFPPCRAS